MKGLFRWLRGYVNVRLWGHQVNRFINLCSRNGIHLWNISHDLHHFVYVHLHLKDVYLLKPFLRKTKTRLRIMKKRGFPFWCHRHPHLKWVPVLLLFLICALIYSRTFIWEIQIEGNEKISDYELLEILETQNITVGVKSKVLDCNSLEYVIRDNFTNIGWVSVYLEHTKLHISIRESLYDEHLPDINDGKRYDFIANKDAYIYTIVTRTGTAVVNSGMYVKKGDLLVKGTFDVFDDSGIVKQVQSVRADAYILGDVIYDFYAPITELEIMGLKLAGVYSDKTLRRIGNQKAQYFIENLEKDSIIILDQSMSLKKNEKNIVYEGKIFAREQIGSNILVEEVSEQ